MMTSDIRVSQSWEDVEFEKLKSHEDQLTRYMATKSKGRTVRLKSTERIGFLCLSISSFSLAGSLPYWLSIACYCVAVAAIAKHVWEVAKLEAAAEMMVDELIGHRAKQFSSPCESAVQ